MGTTPYSFMKSCRLFAAIRALAVFIQRRTTFRAKAGFGAGRCFGFDRGADRLGCRLCRSSFLNDRFCRRFLHRSLRSRLCRNRFLNRGCFYRSLCAFCSSPALLSEPVLLRALLPEPFSLPRVLLPGQPSLLPAWPEQVSERAFSAHGL